MVITGNVGKLRVGYHEAATLSKWRLTRDDLVLNPTHHNVTAVVVHRDAFWITQPGNLRVALWMGGSWWVWYNAAMVDVTERTAELLVSGNPVAMETFN